MGKAMLPAYELLGSEILDRYGTLGKGKKKEKRRAPF